MTDVVDGDFTEIAIDRALARRDEPVPVRDLMPREHDGQLWDRQQSESTKAYSWFDTYRGLGPERSMMAAYNIHRRMRGLPPAASKVLPGQWVRVSNTWSWRRRAEAFDEYQISLSRREEDERRRKDREQRIQLAQALGAKAAVALKAIPESEWTVGDAIQATKVSIEQRRREFDDEPTKRVSVSDGDEAPPVKVFINVSPDDL